MKNVVIYAVACILCFLAGIGARTHVDKEELNRGPVYGNSYLTEYLQDLYSSAYQAGAAKGLSTLFGDNRAPTYSTYYEWMAAYKADPEKAIEKEGLDYLQNIDSYTEIYKKILDRYLGLEE